MAQTSESIPGVSDIFPEEAVQWQALERLAHETFCRYGYGELRCPIFERTEVFQRNLGDETDIVQKEMYTFADRGGRSLTLRPEGTAGVMRALAGAGIPSGDERRVYYIGPMFRGERPAAGRKRQFHQVGVECVGKVSPAIDVECLEMLMGYLRALGITSTRLLINSRGDAEDRARGAAMLREYFGPRIGAMCPDCQRRLQTNAWRLLDCKVESCRAVIAAAPPMTGMLGEASQAYFASVCTGLEALGVPYQVEPGLVRGLDYYCHTVWEVVFEGIGAQNSIAGGGRYEFLFPGSKTPIIGVGWAAGMERLLLAREQLGVSAPVPPGADVYLVNLGDAARQRALVMARDLRRAGVCVLMDLESRGMKAQMRSANKANARFTMILGDDELARQVIVCKDMTSGEQSDLALGEAASQLAAKLGR